MKIKILILSLLLICSAFMVAGNISQKAEAAYFFWEDFEPVDPPGWTSTGLWHYVDDTVDPCIGVGGHPASSYTSWGSYGYHDDASCDYDTGAQNWGELTSPLIDLSAPVTAWLHFWMYYDVEAANTIVDIMLVEASADNSTWIPEQKIENIAGPNFYPESQWVRVDVDLSAYVGDPSVWIRFNFDSIDFGDNMYAGWYVDDVLIDDVPPAAAGVAFPFSENFDAGPPAGWSWTSYWHHTDENNDMCMLSGVAEAPSPPPYLGHPKTSFSSPGSMGYHIDPPNPGGADCTYDDGQHNKGWLKTPPIDLSGTLIAYLSFWFWADVEIGWEALQVQVSTDDITYTNLDNLGVYFTQWPAPIPPNTYRLGMWNFYGSDLTPVPGVIGSTTVWIRFNFDTTDPLSNNFAGWYIDDVVVSEITSIQSHYILTSSPPVADGVYNPGEYIMNALPSGANNWDDLTVIDPANPIPAFLIIENDFQNLYIVYDVVGDMTFDVAPADGAHISFDPENDDAIGGTDLDEEWGMDGFAPPGPYHWSNGVGPVDACAPPPFCFAGFGPSDNSGVPHRIFEFMIPLTSLGFGANPNLPWPVTLGYTMGFGGSAGPSGLSPGIVDVTAGSFDQWPLLTGGAYPQNIFGDLILGVPYVLANDYPLRETAPTAAPNPVDEVDAFQFGVNAWDHAVVGIRQTVFGGGDDYSMVATPDTTFAAPMELSMAGTDIVDLIVVDKTTYVGPPNLGAIAGWSAGTNPYDIEMENDFDDHDVTTGWGGMITSTEEGLEVLDAFEVYAPAAGNYDITLVMPPTIDLDLFLFDVTPPATATAGRVGGIGSPLASSETNGAGVTETIAAVALNAGTDYLLVVTNEDGGMGYYAINPLLVTGADLAPVNVNQWDVSIEMLGLNLVNTNTGGPVSVSAITTYFLGASSLDVSAVTIYWDVNSNSAFDPLTDILLGRADYAGFGSVAVPFPAPLNMGPSATADLLVMYNIAPQASVANTVGAGVIGPADFVASGVVYVPAPIASSAAVIGAGTIPTINSIYQAAAPSPDGVYSAGEHIVMGGVNAFNLISIAGNAFPAWLIVENDDTYLYVTYDAIGDTMDDGVNDFSSMAFDTDNNDAPTVGEDDEFDTQGPGHYDYDGVGWSFLDACTTPSNDCVVGFGTSDNDLVNPHKIYEYRIPLALINAIPIPPIPIGFWGGSHNWGGIMDNSNIFLYDTWPQFNFFPPPLAEYGDLTIGGPPGDVLTVVGNPIGPVTVNPGDTDVVMKQLTLTAGSGSVDVNSIQVDQIGTAVDADTGVIYLYDDVNDDGILDIPGDTLLDSQNFIGGTLTFTIGPPFTVIAGTPENLLVVFDIAPGATLGNTLQIELANNGYIAVTAPDVVSAANFPITCNVVTITAPAGDILTVVGNPIGPVFVNPGDVNVVMKQLTLTAGSGSIDVTNIQIDQIGTAVDADTANIYLYDDVNDDGILDIPGDTLFDQAPFIGGTLTFVGFTHTVTAGTPENLLIVFDIDPLATIGNTLQIELANNGYVTVTAPDAVSAATFPITCNVVTIMAPGDVLFVQGIPVGPVTVNPNDANVVMKQLNLIAGSGSVDINSIQIDQIGTGVDADTGNIFLYDDVNDDGILDLPGDIMLDAQTFIGGTLTFTLAPAFTVTAGTPENLLIVFDIAAGATIGNTLQIGLVNNGYIAVTAPDTVNAADFPITCNVVTIMAPGGDVLTVVGNPIGPATVNPGNTNVVMKQLTLTAGSGSINLTDIQVDQIGTGVDADTGNIYLYDDVNDDGILDIPGDVLLDTQTFVGGMLTFTPAAPFTITTGTPENLLIVFDIAVGATIGNTLQIELANNGYVTVTAPDVVSGATFPITCNVVTIAIVPLDTLTASGTDLAPATAYVGATNISMYQLTLTAGSNSVTVADIDVDLSGTGADADIASVDLYDDVDDSGTLNVGDLLLDSATFAGGTLSFTPLTYTITAGTPENLLIIFNISGTATIGNFVGLIMGTNIEITVSAPDAVSTANFPLISGLTEIIGGSITGKVVDEDGNPIEGANVQLIDTSTGNIIDVESTNTTGDFVFTNAPFDSYTLNASASGYEHNDTATSTISLGTPTYSVGNIELTAAEPVAPPPPTSGTLEGYVYDAEGNPVQGATVELIDDNGNLEGTKTTDSNGKYRFEDVTFDTYTIKVTKDGYEDSTSGEFTLDANNPTANTATTLALPSAEEEVLPMWSWAIILALIVVMILLLLALLMARRKKPEVAPLAPSGPEMALPEESMPPPPPAEPEIAPEAPPEPGLPPPPPPP